MKIKNRSELRCICMCNCYEEGVPILNYFDIICIKTVVHSSKLKAHRKSGLKTCILSQKLQTTETKLVIKIIDFERNQI